MTDRGDQPSAGIGGEELDPGQSAGGQIPEEGEPARAVCADGDLHAEDLAVSIVVDAGDKDVPGPDTAAFAELEDQGVGSTKVNGPGSWRRQGAELPNVLVELLGPHQTWLLDRPVMRRVWEPATVNPS
ncbi:hypothetical protein GCM10009811_16130 [Nostocoides veronense]|uniref:Uncharacterized protein n=1 Tax=Nostocoides veronense TaxID=330836 RepID=A0ABP4XTZ2_9MICO